jgi:hypothetical protein
MARRLKRHSRGVWSGSWHRRSGWGRSWTEPPHAQPTSPALWPWRRLTFDGCYPMTWGLHWPFRPFAFRTQFSPGSQSLCEQHS